MWVAYGEFSKEILIGPRRVSSLPPRFIFAQATHSRDLNTGETREFDLPRNRPSVSDRPNPLCLAIHGPLAVLVISLSLQFLNQDSSFV